MERPTFPELYERWLVEPLFRPWVDPLLDLAAVAPGHRLLDVACGTGIVARVAAHRVGSPANVVGVDSDPEMLDVARTVAPQIEWRLGDALELPIQADEAFDVATCQQGLQFFPDKVKALDQMRLTLKPGGRAAVATWRPLDENGVFGELHAVAEAMFGPIQDRRHSFGHGEALAQALESAGFRNVVCEVVSRTVRFDDARGFLEMNSGALVGMAGVPREDRRDAVARLIEASRPVVERSTTGGALSSEMRTNVAVGVR